MRKQQIKTRPGYALLISLILLTLSAGVVVFEFRYQKQQSMVNHELMLKFQSQIRQNLDKLNDNSREKVPNLEGESGKKPLNN
ncbi:hypothetical protein [Limosilactobacillus fastidiosus]|nr:hypothetical protein [Limosilactobacillus fastidiosus]MBB1085442.1 hypothetical protein [Limosilactobacillus fastidiosus]MCD7085344.1 hypothetical protein [Limosilactobacillus fastidiosus]MCD7115446.1 hypothetical protein [Limosilactobacillus fastidiosus]